MFGLNPVKMTVRNNAISWTGNGKILQKTAANSANSQGAKDGEVAGSGREGTFIVSHIAKRKRNQTIRKPQKCWTELSTHIANSIMSIFGIMMD